MLGIAHQRFGTFGGRRELAPLHPFYPFQRSVFSKGWERPCRDSVARCLIGRAQRRRRFGAASALFPPEPLARGNHRQDMAFQPITEQRPAGVRWGHLA